MTAAVVCRVVRWVVCRDVAAMARHRYVTEALARTVATTPTAAKETP